MLASTASCPDDSASAGIAETGFAALSPTPALGLCSNSCHYGRCRAKGKGDLPAVVQALPGATDDDRAAALRRAVGNSQLEVTKALLTAGVPTDTYGPTQGYTALQQCGPFEYSFTFVNASNIFFGTEHFTFCTEHFVFWN